MGPYFLWFHSVSLLYAYLLVSRTYLMDSRLWRSEQWLRLVSYGITCNCDCHYPSTYIIGHYNPWVRIIDLVSHTTYVVCVNLIHKWRDLQFKVDSELFMAILFTLMCFLFYQKMCILYQKMQFRVCFLKGWYVLF